MRAMLDAETELLDPVHGCDLQNLNLPVAAPYPLDSGEAFWVGSGAEGISIWRRR
jgi:hypothetical protein